MRTKSEQLEGEGVGDEVCASCGIAAIDDVKLKDCDGGCDLVKYCGDGCQINHREQHEDECKQRVDDIHDKQLFTQPDISHRGECPICCLPLPLEVRKSTFMSCCSKIICRGCDYTNQIREREAGLERRCVYCREPAPNSDEEVDKRIMERIKKNDPAAMTQMGKKHNKEGEHDKALEYWAKAAELGDMQAHACLGELYYHEDGVEKDKEKAVYHLEKAAIGGHPGARILLADYEIENDRKERAAKHLMIAANLGCNDSLEFVKSFYVKGMCSKEDYAAALRGHQAAVNDTKSAEREKAEAFFDAREAARRN
jgi:hypothetical protein